MKYTALMVGGAFHLLERELSHPLDTLDFPEPFHGVEYLNQEQAPRNATPMVTKYRLIGPAAWSENHTYLIYQPA